MSKVRSDNLTLNISQFVARCSPCWRCRSSRRQASRVHRRNTAHAVESALRTHAYPVFGSRPLTSIRPSETQAYIVTLSQTLAPSTVRVTYQHLRSVFLAAEADNIIAKSPCQRVSLPRSTARSNRCRLRRCMASSPRCRRIFGRA